MEVLLVAVVVRFVVLAAVLVLGVVAVVGVVTTVHLYTKTEPTVLSSWGKKRRRLCVYATITSGYISAATSRTPTSTSTVHLPTTTTTTTTTTAWTITQTTITKTTTAAVAVNHLHPFPAIHPPWTRMVRCWWCRRAYGIISSSVLIIPKPSNNHHQWTSHHTVNTRVHTGMTQRWVGGWVTTNDDEYASRE